MDFKKRTGIENFSEIQLREMRRAFYGGFVAGINLEPTLEDLGDFSKEAMAFLEDIKNGRA